MNDEKVSLPTNVKQIGSISGDERIYMEDYACTYLQQYAACDPNREKAAILVGKSCQTDGERVLFISGVIQGKYTVRRNGLTELTEKTWQYVAKQMRLFFDGLEVVGWAYIQPGFEDYLSDGIMEYQRKNADRGLGVLFLNDPAEKLSSFFKWDSESETFSTVRGYLVYYEKNEGMHEYMLENKLKPVVKEDTASKAVEEPLTTDEKIAKTVRSEGARSKNRVFAEQKRLSNLLGSVSFVMLLVCFVMGAGLIRSDERINTLEHKINLMQNDIDGVQSVFASQNLTQQTTAATTTETVTQPTTSESATQAQTQEYGYYTVEEGDTILKICKNEYGSGSRVDEIMEINNIDDPGKLYVGMELKLPKE